MIEQINIALEQKGPGISQPGSLEACRRRQLTSEKAYIELKVMKNEHPAFFPRTGRYCKFIVRGIAVIELQFYHFPDSDRLRVGSVTD